MYFGENPSTPNEEGCTCTFGSLRRSTSGTAIPLFERLL
jgi:hypothetical protein